MSKSSSSESRDIAWRPIVPLGHTKYSWIPTQRANPVTATSPSSSTSSDSESPKASFEAASNPVRGSPVLPTTNNRNILITSALPYVNNVPHLGTLIGCVLSADVYARFCRLRGYNTVYICGTDEYGTATETKALEEGVTPQQICDKYFAIHSRIYKYFDIEFDHFGRTTTRQQTEITQEIFKDLDSNGYIKEDSVQQLFCLTCNTFLADRFVEGTCPECRSENARGDQCDKCGKLYDPIELINPQCNRCRNTPEVRTSKHLFLDLQTLTPPLDQWIKTSDRKPYWTENASAITQDWLKKGLLPRCITRDLKWGTPVPHSEKRADFAHKVFYVWFDAPIGYISITANYTEEWRQWWLAGSGTVNKDNQYQEKPASKNVELVQFMGKDNVPFHCVMFPASLLGTRKNWSLLHRISTTEFLNYEGGKFSKSRNIGVFGDDVEDTKIPVEVWRYYLLANRPEASDSMFLWTDFAAKNNTELSNNVGNLIQRVLKFVYEEYKGEVPNTPAKENYSAEEIALIDQVTSHINDYIKQLEDVNIKEGLKIAMHLSHLANEYYQKCQAWTLRSTDRARCDVIISFAVNIIATIALLLEPYIPSFSTKVYTQLQWSPSSNALSAHVISIKWSPVYIKGGHRIIAPTPIFKQISDDEVVAIRNRFGGKRGVIACPLKCVLGVIIEAKPHPKVDKQVVMTVKIGSADTDVRTVISRLGRFYSQEQLINKAAVVIINVKPTNFKGVVGNAQVMLAVNGAQSLGLLTVDTHHKGSLTPGAEVLPRKAVFDEKVEFFDTSKSKTLPLAVDQSKIPTFAGQPFVVKAADGSDLPIIAENITKPGELQFL